MIKGKCGSNAGLVLSIILFYSVIFLLLYNYGSDKYYSNVNLGTTAGVSDDAPGWFEHIPVIGGLFSFFKVFVFFRIMGFAVSGIPFWMNLLIFTPLTLLIAWIILEWVRGSG